jgi:hypothetical protein
MAITLGNTTISGLGVGGLPSGTVNSTTLADSSITRAKLGYNGGVVQFSYSYFEGGSYSNTGWNTIANIGITPVYSNSRIVIHCTVPFCVAAGHAAQGRWLRDGNWLSDGYPSSGNREPGYGGEEGVSSDGGMSFGLNAVDNPGSTSALTYALQTRSESGATSGWGRSQQNNSDQNAGGYPGIYRTYMIIYEIRNGF